MSSRGRFLNNAHGRPIYADSTKDAAATKRLPKQTVRAAIVVLARDSDCEGVLRSMARMEQRFNAKFGYPYVFLNNDPFGADFVNRYLRHSQAPRKVSRTRVSSTSALHAASRGSLVQPHSEDLLRGAEALPCCS